MFSFRMVFFCLVTTGWIFGISLCESSTNSINQTYIRQTGSLVFEIQLVQTVQQTEYLCGSIVKTETESDIVVGCECMNCLELLGKYHVMIAE